MYKDKFVLSIICNDSPVKESGSVSNRQVAIPFGSEYKIRLKNKNDRSCTAKVTIDGTPASNFGDIIVTSGGTVDLERFITNSMDSGKKFRFVRLSHSDVDDPSKLENGIVRVEFRLAKASNGIKIIPPYPWPPIPCEPDDWPCDPSPSTKQIYDRDNTLYYSAPITYSCSNFTGSITPATKCKSSNRGTTAPGATIEGGYSNQSFTYSNLDVESCPTTILTLKIVGIDRDVPCPYRSSKYCTYCGHKIRKNDRYCGGCGRKI